VNEKDWEPLVDFKAREEDRLHEFTPIGIPQASPLKMGARRAWVTLDVEQSQRRAVLLLATVDSERLQRLPANTHGKPSI
jgi:hypothetical protein